MELEYDGLPKDFCSNYGPRGRLEERGYFGCREKTFSFGPPDDSRRRAGKALPKLLSGFGEVKEITLPEDRV